MNPFQFEWFAGDPPWGPPERASSEGIVGIGGDLRPELLLRAYAAGVFPWFSDDDPILWWSPDPRGVLEFDKFHVPRRLAATLRKAPFRVTVNADFEGVIRGCADRDDGTWLTETMIDAYLEMHRLGHAHSLETWAGDELAGGIYGIALGGFFAGESMFHRRTDASKVALVHLVHRLMDRGFELMDLQVLNDHTMQFGASDIPRSEYLRRLKQAVAKPVTFV